jgi:hypothetical protein
MFWAASDDQIQGDPLGQRLLFRKNIKGNAIDAGVFYRIASGGFDILGNRPHIRCGLAYAVGALNHEHPPSLTRKDESGAVS